LFLKAYAFEIDVMLQKAMVLFLAMVFSAICSVSQPVLSINGSSNFYVSAGQTVSLDSLVLVPSAGYNLTASNVLSHTTSLTHGSSTPAIQRAYSFSGTLSNYNGTLSIYYLSSELNGLTPSMLQVNAYNTSWANYAGTDGTNFATVSGLTNVSFNELSLASSTAPLPLFWLSVAAVRDNAGTQIRWSTTDESGCYDFNVQKSADGVNWTDPAPSQAARNRNGPNVYSWTDMSMLTGQVFYRILETNDDGSVRYSPIVVMQAVVQAVLTIYPNPANGFLVVKAAAGRPGILAVRIADGKGHTILSAFPAGERQYVADLGRLSKGAYTVRVDLADGSSTAKIFIKD
jgi:hypothetical protein